MWLSTVTGFMYFTIPQEKAQGGWFFFLPPNREHLCQCWRRSIMSSCTTPQDWGLLGRQVSFLLKFWEPGDCRRAQVCWIDFLGPILRWARIARCLWSPGNEPGDAFPRPWAIPFSELRASSLCRGGPGTALTLKREDQLAAPFPLLLMKKWKQHRAGIFWFTTRWW